MESSYDSNSLFIDQIRQHADALTDVLSNGRNGENGITDLMEACIRSTRMIAGSALIMGLGAWHRCWNALEELFVRYRRLEFGWDERIAQVVSEMIEKEELLVSAQGAGDIIDPASIVADEEVQALIEEIGILLEAEETVEVSRTQESKAAPAGIHPSVVDTRAPLAITRVSLEEAIGLLNKALSTAAWPGAAGNNGEIEKIHRNLRLIDFYARSMNEVLELQDGPMGDPIAVSLEPVRIVLEDYAGLLRMRHGRSITVSFDGTDNGIDAGLLFEVGRVLQYMMRDVFLRCDDAALNIRIEVTEKNGALWWKVRDDGNNFIKDSKVDRDEFLAFYPSLKQVKKTLEGFNSILWVEPDDDKQTRFVFTTRVNEYHKKFVVWGSGENCLGVLSPQYCSLLPAQDAAIESDSRGEHLVVDGRKVPLVNLQLVYPGAPEAGDKIAVIGSLEHNVAIYVDGEGRVVEGVWNSDAVSGRKGLPRGVAELDEGKVPIIEAGELLVRLLSTSGETVEDGISGGVAGDGTDLLPESQATFLEEASSPPDCNEKDEEVLVVEQSKAVVEAFETMFPDAKFNMTIVERVEDALDFIRGRSPRLIISEFRMPTLAAQKIKNALQKEGKNIPIVVTTSHTGANADLLVKKLGVADYLSKPLQADMVSAKIEHFLKGEIIASGSNK